MQQCSALTESGSQCERKSKTINCWQHNLVPELKNQILPELADISYNYLSLEDLISLTDGELQRELINKFYPELPEDYRHYMYEAIENGWINTVKYIFSKMSYDMDDIFTYAEYSIRYDQLEIFKIICEQGNNFDKTIHSFLPDYQNLLDSFKYGSMKILKYLASVKIIDEYNDVIKNENYYSYLYYLLNNEFNTEAPINAAIKYVDYLTEEKIYPTPENLFNIFNDLNKTNLFNDFIVKLLGLTSNLDKNIIDILEQLLIDSEIPEKEKIFEALKILRLKLC